MYTQRTYSAHQLRMMPKAQREAVEHTQAYIRTQLRDAQYAHEDEIRDYIEDLGSRLESLVGETIDELWNSRDTERALEDAVDKAVEEALGPFETRIESQEERLDVISDNLLPGITGVQKELHAAWSRNAERIYRLERSSLGRLWDRLRNR